LLLDFGGVKDPLDAFFGKSEEATKLSGLVFLGGSEDVMTKAVFVACIAGSSVYPSIVK
jgi:hypothetical protein